MGFVVVLVSAAIGAAACVGSSKRASSSSTSSTAGVVLRVGDQGQYLETPLRASGQLDNLGYKVEFATFNSGPLVNQAFNAHQIDVGFMGDTPASATVRAQLGVKAVGVFHADGPAIVLLARPGIATV